MPFAEVDLIDKDGERVPDLPEGTEFAVVDHISDNRVLVETAKKVPARGTRKDVAKKPPHAKGGLNVQDSDPDFLSRALSKEEKAEQKKLGRAMTAAERATVRQKSEKIPGKKPPKKDPPKPVDPPTKKAASR